MIDKAAAVQSDVPDGSPGEVFGAFAKLGVTAFGGPIAHLAYFRDEFVTRRGWLSEAAFADLVALCQFLPGPASSQVGFAIGLMRAGWRGALAAFTAFTLPSAALLVAFAFLAGNVETGVGADLVHGLKIAAVAVIAQAVFGMARSLTPDRKRATIAVMAIAVVAFTPVAIGQIAAIALGAVAGLALCSKSPAASNTPPAAGMPVDRRVALACLAVFALLLAVAFLATSGSPDGVGQSGFGPGGFLAGIYRSGALVFGGGHVVLPLLEAQIVTRGFIDESTFLAGYGATQAVPGPLFTFGAYLGAAYGGVTMAILALAAIFVPGFLLLVGVLPFWSALSQHPSARAALAGTNAAVVGLLGAALYNPVFTSAISDGDDFVLAVFGFVLLVLWRAPPWSVVALLAIGGIAAG